jgi:hypothetical protein
VGVSKLFSVDYGIRQSIKLSEFVKKNSIKIKLKIRNIEIYQKRNIKMIYREKSFLPKIPQSILDKMNF